MSTLRVSVQLIAIWSGNTVAANGHAQAIIEAGVQPTSRYSRELPLFSIAVCATGAMVPDRSELFTALIAVNAMPSKMPALSA